MTGVLQAVAAGAPFGPQNFSVSLFDAHSGAPSSASIILNADGSVSLTGAGSSSASPRWYQPGPGAPTYFAQLTNSGALPTSGVGTALTPTSVAPNWGWATSLSSAQTLTANPTIRLYSDGAGTQLAATIPVSVSVIRS
jgi:hypothetical protein